MGFTAADVKNLREMTGVGMMTAKRPSPRPNEKGRQWLREKMPGIAAEGMAYAWVCPECRVSSIVEVNAGDFRRQNDLFVDYVHKVAQVVGDAPRPGRSLRRRRLGKDRARGAERQGRHRREHQVRRFARYDKPASPTSTWAQVLMNLDRRRLRKNPPSSWSPCRSPR